MVQEEVIVLVKKIQEDRCESNFLELKKASGGCPNKLYDTFSSFSNQDEGGVIAFGIDETTYELVGVYNAADLQKKVAEKCLEMEPPVRAILSASTIEGKSVVIAEIPGVQYEKRPVYYKPKGIVKGSYVRVGDADLPMTKYEIYQYDAYRRGIKEDRRVVDTGWVMRDEDLLKSYVDKVRKGNNILFENLADEEILELHSIVKGGKPTMTGLMVFSKYPQASFPNLAIKASRSPGIERGAATVEGMRFLESKKIVGSIPLMLEEAMKFVARNSRVQITIDASGQRIDRPEYPVRAVREAIINALIHRDYSRYTEDSAILIEMYQDRMEIINKGGIYGNVSVTRLGKESPETRNSTLTAVMEELEYSENRFSGIPTMRSEMLKAGLPEPVFEDNQNEFKVIFYNHQSHEVEQDVANNLTEVKAFSIFNSLSNIEKECIHFCRTAKSRAEIAEYLGKTRNYVSSSIIRPLLDSGLLQMTIPEKPKSKNQMFVVSELYQNTLAKMDKDTLSE